MQERSTYSEIQVGDSIQSYIDPKGPSWLGANGRLWSGEVTAVSQSGDKVAITVDVHGRSLCADDLVYGFGNTRDAHVGVTKTLYFKPSDYLLKRVRDLKTGVRYWSGIQAFGPDEVERTPEDAEAEMVAREIENEKAIATETEAANEWARLHLYETQAARVRELPEVEYDADGMIDCDGCKGDGVYFGRGYVENGVFKGTTGQCYRCSGKGRQTPADVKRNAYYDNRVRVIPSH